MQTNELNQDGPAKARQTVGVLGKALDVLEEIIWSPPRSVGELAAITGVEKAAVYRITNTLVDRGFAVKDEETRKYRSGPRLAAAATWLDRTQDIAKLAGPYMRTLREEFEETVNLGVLVGQEIQYLDILESRHSLRMSVEAGTRHNAYSTALGKAILACRSAEGARLIMGGRSSLKKVTSHTISDWDAFAADLEQVRHRGYSIDFEENELGAVCVAAAVGAPSESATYAISISCPVARVGRGEIHKIGERLVQVCSALSDESPS